MENHEKILAYLEENQKKLIGMFKEFVELESPSHENKAAADKCSGFLQEKFKDLGFEITAIAQETCGDHVYGEIGEGEKSALFVGHYDTVYPIGTIEKMPFKTVGSKIYGPGTLDMKGGIIMAYYAVKALIDLDMMPSKKIGVFWNGDEESGSFHSKDLIIEKGKQYDCVLVMEPGINDICTIKMGRFGRGTYRVTARGNAAHSGSNTHLAISPLTELAKQLLFIEEWNKSMKGDATIAPTFISGGIPGTCMIPETAYFTMDVRYKTKQIAEAIHEEILNLQPATPGIVLGVNGAIDKPVMTGDEKLFKRIAGIAEKYNMDLKRVTVGGGSDGNFTSAAGIPTVDGLGMSGEFLHNPEEYVNADHIAYRTALVAAFLREAGV